MKNKYHTGVENIVRKGEIACYKQFLLFSQCFHSCISLVRKTAALCGNGLKGEHAGAELNLGCWIGKITHCLINWR